MNAKSFVILYTRQTKKKHKVWHDGTLKFISNNKGLLYDDKGTKLDSVFVKDNIQIGDQLESDHYLITIEELLSSSEERTNDRYADQVHPLSGTRTIARQQSLYMQGRSNLKLSVTGNPPRQNRVGLKRQRNSSFVPPLLKTSMTVDNQREMSPFISDPIREAHQNKNQTSYQNPSVWRSFVTKENVSNDVSLSLNFENTKDNPTEMHSSESWSRENMDFGRKGPVYPGMSGSSDPLPAADQFYANEDRTTNLVDSETQFNKESFFDFNEKPTDLITDSRIQTSCDRMYTEDNVQNLVCDSEILHHNKSISHFPRKKATVPFTSDERVKDAGEGFNANLSEAISSCDKRENISDPKPLPNNKNKRTASQVMALLKLGTSEITKDTEREGSARNLLNSVNVSLSEGISKSPKPFKDHSNNKKNLNEKQQEADFIDQVSLRPSRNIVNLSDLAKNNELYLSQTADRDSEFPQILSKDSEFPQILSKDSDVTNINSPCDVSEESFLDINISPVLKFDMKNDKSPCGIGSRMSPDECVEEENTLFSIEGFKRSMNMQESSELLVRDTNETNFNKNVSERTSFVPTALMSTVSPMQDWSPGEVSSDNNTKNSLHAVKFQKNNDQEVALPFEECNNKPEDENLSPKINTSAEKHDQTLLFINNRADYKTFQETESNIIKTMQRDLTLYKAVIASSPNDNPNNKKELGSTADTNSIIQADITVDKDNQNKRPLAFSTTEEPQSKRFRSEPKVLDTDSAINRDELCRIESHMGDIIESLSPKASIFTKGSKNADSPSEILNQTENVHEEVLENVLDEKVLENVHIEVVSENVHIEEVSENVPVEEEPKNVHIEEVSENVPVEEEPENVHIEEMSENVHIEVVSENVPVEEMSENVPVEEVSENIPIEEVSENVHIEEESENFHIEEMSENVPVEEVSENVLNVEVFGLLQSEDNHHTSGISDSAHVSNNNFSSATKDKGEFTNVNVSSFPQTSNDKSISKYSFKSVSANKNKDSNWSHAEDDIIQKNKSQNDISLQINESENMCNLSNALSCSSLSNSVVLLNNGSSVVCSDNSSSDDELNFDLSFDFDDNFHQAKNKQTDADQNTESENLEIGNIKSDSCFLDPQVQNEEKSITKGKKKTETVEIPRSISTDDSSIGSNVISNKQNISDSSHVNTSIFDNLNPQLKETNHHFDFNSHPIPASRDVAKIVSKSSSSHLKTKNEIFNKSSSLENNNPVNITFDIPLSNPKETVQKCNPKEYLSNNPCVKKDGLILDNPYKFLENRVSESQIKPFDFGGSKINSQELDEIWENYTPNADNGKNMNLEAESSNILYSSLDELSFSPDPFDKFESDLDKISCQKEMIPSKGSGISKPSGLTNIVDSPVIALEMSPLHSDKINTSGTTDVDEVIFSPMPHGEKVHAKLEFNSMNSITDHTQNSDTLSGKSKIYRIGQLFPLTIGQNIPEERSQRLAKHQDFEHQQRHIQRIKSIRRPSEIYEDPLPHPSRLKGRIEPPKKSLLSRAADLNGYQMHGSVSSDMVKRTVTSRNTEVNSLVFNEEKWGPETFHNSTRSFSPQENDNASYTEQEFGGDFNSIVPKMIKGTKMNTYPPRIKTWGKDLYSSQNNPTYYDFDQIVPSHNDITCSPNNEIDITVPSFPNSLAYGQPSSPCPSPCTLSPKDFENGFPESTSYFQNEFISYQEFSNEFPLSPHEAFSNYNFALKKQKYRKTLEGSSFDYEHYPETQGCSQVSFNPYCRDPRKTYAFSEHSNTEQTKSFYSYSPPSLTHNIDSPNGYPSDNPYEINKISTDSNNELNTIMKSIDLDIPPRRSSIKNDSLREFVNATELKNLEIQHILVADNEESELPDCQIISCSGIPRYEHGESHSDMKSLSPKRKTEPLKCKPFEDSVTHENYHLYYYYPKSCPGENKELENIGTNKENEFSEEKQLHNSLDFEREVLINRNIQLKNEMSNQFENWRNEGDGNSIKENHVVNHSQQEICSMQSADHDQDTFTLFPESEFLKTYSFYKDCTSPDNIREYVNPEGEEDSTLCSNSFSESFGLLSPPEDPFNEPKRLRIQHEDDRHLYNKPDLKIFDQIHNEKGSTLFEPDIPQIQKQLEVFNPKCPLSSIKNHNSINLVTTNSYFTHSSSTHLEMAMHNSSSEFTRVAPSFKSPLLTQQSSKIQSPYVGTPDCSPSEPSKNHSEILSDLLKVHKCAELKFPSQQDVAGNMVPKRRMVIPVTFQNVTEYKNILTSVLKEHLNIILFELSSNYNNSMAKADLSSYQHSGKNPSTSSRYPQATGSENQYPNCNCGLPSKMIQVRKDGKNKGRFFYTCKAVQSLRCKFFQWADDFDQQTPRTSSSSLTPLKSQLPKLCDGKSINFYLRRHHINFYCESVFVRQSPWQKKNRKYQRQLECENLKDRLYIRLSFKDPSGCYSKDDLWIISKNLNFEPSVTFLARSVFYGPSSSLELQIEPLAGYFPSNWNTDTVCHAILAGNMSTELNCMMNLQEHVTISSSPIISSLLHRKSLTRQWTRTMPGFKTPFQQCNKLPKYSSHELASLAEKYATFWKLNSGQAKALNNVASMLDSCQSDNSSIILIHGVFGSGKSFLLAIIVLYLLEVIEAHQAMKTTTDSMKDEKILISSTTNVAVDRILLYLLEFGCSEFIRVGSVRKIAKPILPHSVHATSNDNHDLKELQEMLKEENLSKIEKQYVRKSIEMHKLGLNKKKLCAVKVVGVTCASCSFNCLEKMKFPIVFLDECSQMTEPTSLLPLARFGCEKLLLVGDPLQLDPTIQGSEAENEDGLEQSMFDRLLKMGQESVLLQRQYRCHPTISHIANTLFYGRRLEDGIKDTDRPKLVPELPTLCFYDVSDGKEICESSGSFYNTQEAGFVISIILALLASGIEPLSIGVIALYKSQTYEINRKMLESWQHPDNKFLKGKSVKSIQVSTVDAFQGGERDVIILSCVRTSRAGFINNNKRMNVALTRARNHLFIIGKSSNLCTDETWSQVIQICQNSPNSFQSAKQAKIKLLDLSSRAQITDVEQSVGTKTKSWHYSDLAQEK